MGSQIARGFQGADQEADKAGKRAGKRFGGAMGGLAKAGIVGAVAGAGIAAVKGLSTAIGEAREAQKVGATTAQIIKATGGAAKVSAAQVESLAGAISRKAGVDDEAIQKGANLLLTFKNVRNEAGKGGAVFDRATQSAVDLSAAGFGSVENASKMLGKALNDPVKGITALGRAGVTFTDQQKEQIKTLIASGRTLDAQKIILGEVESQVGGVAAASATAGEKMKVAFGNLAEQIGTAALPLLDKFGNVMVNKVVPALSRAVTFLTDNLGPAFASIKNTIAPLTAGFGSLSLSLKSTGDAGGFIKDSLVPALMRVVDAGRGLAAVVLPIIKQIAGEILSRWPEIKPVVMEIFGTVGGIVLDVMGAIKDTIEKVTRVIQFIWSRWGDKITKHVGNAFTTVVEIIGGVMKIVGGIIKVVTGVMTGDWRKAGKGIGQIVSGLKKVLIAIWVGIKNTIGALLKGLIENLRARWNYYSAWVKNELRKKLEKIKDYFLNPIREARDKLYTVMGQIKDTFRKAVTAIGEIWDRLKAKAKAPIKFIVNTVLNNGLIDAFNQIAKVVGAKTIPHVSLPKGFDSGGWTGPGDRMKPAGIVHADEFVVKKKSRRRFEQRNPGALDYLNRHGELPGYARGGLVSYKGGTFTAEFASRLRKVAQKFAYRVFQGGFRPTTSYSGTSHRGDAVDVGPVSGALVRALRAVRIAAWDRTGMGNWAPHIHGVPLPGAGRALGSAIWQAKDYLNGGNGLGGRDNGAGSGGSNKDPGGGGFGGFVTKVINWGKRLKSRLTGVLGKMAGAGSTPFGELAKGMARKAAAVMADKGKSWTQTITSGIAGAGSKIADAAVKGSNRARGLALLLRSGFGKSQWSPLNKLWTKESGWRTRAQNPSSGAYGIPQALPGSKMASAGSDWRTNPNTQIRWGLGYIRSRYGTPAAAWAHSQRTNWYDSGGYLKPGLTIAQNGTGQREKVLNPAQTKAWEAGQVGGVTFNAPVTVADPGALIRKIEANRRMRETLQPSPMI
jgi:phage-related protein